MNVLLVPHIIDHFPSHCQRIIDLCVSNKPIRELCEDYEKLIDTLIESGVYLDNLPASEASSLHDLLILKQELEQELLDRLKQQR